MTAAAQPHQETLKETLISIVIAFTMAFVFRGFVIEAFVIPTGSMAPTLMGAHMQQNGAQTGYFWQVGAWEARRGNDPTDYSDPQPERPVTDPIGSQYIRRPATRLHSGDRILVQKYLYNLRDPRRYEVVVFKNPTDPSQNYIKRLIGLPGEQLALADGDVFVRPDDGQNLEVMGAQAHAALWSGSGWHIARKPSHVQREVWQKVYDTTNAPLTDNREFVPWQPSEPKGWTFSPRSYAFDGSSAATLLFDQTRWRQDQNPDTMDARRKWSIDDFYPYNEPLMHFLSRFPVSDVRVRLAITPAKAEQVVRLLLDARGHEFRASIGGGKAEIAWREPSGGAGVRSDWKVLKTGTAPGLPAGVPTSIEFWHVDQSMQIWVDGGKVLELDYDWSPAERILNATGRSLPELLADQSADPGGLNTLANSGLYKSCEVRVQFEGGPFTVKRLGLDRDLHYQPANRRRGSGPPALATSPYAFLVMGKDQFFCCGDNSPASVDGRIWDSIDPWVNREYPPESDRFPRAGVVPRDMMLGKAFFVYWPSLKKNAWPLAWVPDFGRLRLIW